MAVAVGNPSSLELIDLFGDEFIDSLRLGSTDSFSLGSTHEFVTGSPASVGHSSPVSATLTAAREMDFSTPESIVLPVQERIVPAGRDGLDTGYVEELKQSLAAAEVVNEYYLELTFKILRQLEKHKSPAMQTLLKKIIFLAWAKLDLNAQRKWLDYFIERTAKLPDKHRKLHEFFVHRKYIWSTLAHAGNKKTDIIIYSTCLWDWLMQRPQHMAKELARLGHRIFYLDPSFVWQADPDAWRFISEPVEGVYVCQLSCLPDTTGAIWHRAPIAVEAHWIATGLRRLRRQCGITSAVSLVQGPFWRQIAQSFPDDFLVLEIMDHLEGFNLPKSLLKEEQEMRTRADLLITTAAPLYEKLPQSSPRLLVRNATDISVFAEAPPVLSINDKRPVVGYFGYIGPWFETSWVEHAAKARPDWSFVLVGPVNECDVTALERMKNVTFVGKVDHDKLPGYVHAFDVCMIPFKINELTRCTNPVKAYEYLSAGKPVVSSAMPEVMDMDGMVETADNKEEFLAKIEQCLLIKNDSIGVAKRKSWVRNHTWAKRALMVSEAIDKDVCDATVFLYVHDNFKVTQSCLDSLWLNTGRLGWELVVLTSPQYSSMSKLQKLTSRLNCRTTFLTVDGIGGVEPTIPPLKNASKSHVVFLSDRTFVTQGWLIGLVRHLKRNQDLGLLVPSTNLGQSRSKIELNYSTIDEMQQKARLFCGRHKGELLASSIVDSFCFASTREALEALIPSAGGRSPVYLSDVQKKMLDYGSRIAVARDVFVHQNC
jgi:glycosyltransferase involved in cell wall biosynthesis